MEKRIILNPDRIQTKEDMNKYMMEVFGFEDDYDSASLDALKDSLSEIEEETFVILTPDSIMKICGSEYAYKVLLVIGEAAQVNPYLHIRFRQNGRTGE
ncbi:MAG: hypothetical protein IKE28_01735 [Solobacterium sp.]|nr:hypothetical protein [Solobacterium sp.]